MADTAYMTNEAAEEERLMLDAIEKWIEQKVKPVAMELEHANEYPMELVEDMKELGLFGALIDPEYGGARLTSLLYPYYLTPPTVEWMRLTRFFKSHLNLAQNV